MRFDYNIKRFLSAALLIAFAAPAGLADYYNASPALASSTVLSGNVKLTDKNDNITLSLRDSDVKQVLRMFADKAGKNIVFHDSVKGNVTLDLVNMPLNDAFKLVLQITKLNYYIQNNTLIVMAANSPDNATFSKQEMMVFPVKYVSAGKIANFLNSNVFGMKQAGMSGIDAATVNSATNELIVFGMKSDAAIVEKVIAQFDREPLQRTFAVNHTTPAEMANMICDVLLPSRGATSGKGTEAPPIPPTPGVGTGGAAGILTGAAAGTGDDIKLGEGIVACSASSGGSSRSTAAFDVQNLSVAYFPQRGTITLMGGSVEQQNMVERFIKENDIKQSQAYVEVSIIELNEDGSKEFSNTWDIQSESWFFNFNGGTSKTGRQASPGTKDFIKLQQLGDGGKSLETLYMPREQWYRGGSYITWYMNYLIENKKARMLANPKVLVTSGRESVIDLTQDYVEKVTTEFLSSTATGSGTTGATNKQYTIGKDQGIKITLTPFISPEGYVTMNINANNQTPAAEIRTPSEADPTQTDLQATLLSRRNLEMQNVRIKDGETLAIGGLIQERDVKTVQKIPVLGDLPIIGAAFRSSSTTKSKTEVIVMITPRIINDNEGSIADSL